MTNEMYEATKQTVQEVVHNEGIDVVQEATKEAIKDVAKNIGENTKLDISLQGAPAAVFLSILSACAAGAICYGIYTWGEVQKSHNNKASN